MERTIVYLFAGLLGVLFPNVSFAQAPIDGVFRDAFEPAGIFFSDCQAGAAAGCVPGNNANAGSIAAPKRDLSGIGINALPAGTRLHFARGGAWNWTNVRLENALATASRPLSFEAYGAGPRPLFNAPGIGSGAIDFGDYNNTSNDGGYVFRGLKFDGQGSTAHAFFLIHNLHDVTIEDCELTGFYIAIHAQARAPHGLRHIAIRNNQIVRNGGMGILGQLRDSVIEGNTFGANNVGGSGFDHGTYLSGDDGISGINVTLRNNRYLRNSVVNGVCTGGNMTFHGQMDGLLIEGNTIEQDAAAEGCWLMSITQGRNTPEWFRNVVVRGNTLVNGGNTIIAVQSAPGILIEDNRIFNTQLAFQVGIGVGSTEYQGGDVPDGNAIVRNNIGCYPTPGHQSTLVRVTAPDSLVTNNLSYSGAAATTGPCLRE
ncbi:MAG TPA: right-handed parallel beta-helix repeat-containing protein [Tahibacter sp.]|uniref:right-handed parallel beta-helix repeat-containing protein n=1 Tax=Tahibacter sp. TaxID=2056211 RepID=UPI002D19D1A1|nr:right-handed parallel beta-helix repeat-containing protein [Tahibacter sp.]HSX62302.1 right-handed parallel beta-helix repeat-containing protein [Tahibacter sp.]